MTAMNPQTPVEAALREIERHVSESGWDQPTRLFALVSTTELALLEPSLAEQLADEPDVATLTSVEQDRLPSHNDLTDLLMGMSWPPNVLGAAIVAERIMLPTNAEQDLPRDPEEARKRAASDPRRHEMRIAAAAMRDGTSYSLLRLREHDADDALIAGPQVMAGLCELIAESLSD